MSPKGLGAKTNWLAIYLQYWGNSDSDSDSDYDSDSDSDFEDLQILKYGHSSRGTRNQEWLCWRRTAVIYPSLLYPTLPYPTLPYSTSEVGVGG
jgi:hypothetical protein